MEYHKVFLLLAAFFIYNVCGNVSVPPTNQVVLNRGSATFKCSIDFDTQADAFRWKKSTKEDATQQDTIYQSYPLDFVYDDKKYTIDNPDPNTYNLIINNVDTADAGTYYCSRILDDTSTGLAELVVLEEPILTLPRRIEEDDTVSMSCDFNYMGRKSNPEDLTPSLSLKMGDMDITNRVTPVVTEGTLGSMTTLVSVTFNSTISKSHHGQNFTCTASTRNPAFSATKAAAFDVLFPVTEESIKMEPMRDVYYVGEVIACTAEGNPAPKVSWVPKMSKGAHSSGANLTITEQMVGENEWTCQATNTPKAEPIKAEKLIKFSVVTPTEPPAGESTGLGSKCGKCCQKDNPKSKPARSLPSTQEGGVLPETDCRERPAGSEATIAIGVAVPVVVIIVIVIVVCCVCRKRKKAPVKKPEETQKGQPGNPIYRPVRQSEQVSFQDASTAKYSVEGEGRKPSAAPRRDAPKQDPEA